jgi:hypothetical protein
MEEKVSNFQIPTVNDQVNKLLQSFVLKIHLTAELFSTFYDPFKNLRQKHLNFALSRLLIKDFSEMKDGYQWKEISQGFENKDNHLKNIVYQLLTNIRDSRVGLPILTELSKTVFQSTDRIKRFLPLFIIEEVYNKWTEEKKEKVPIELHIRYQDYHRNNNTQKFEELASRLLNKLFFSSIIVKKIGEELEYRLFNEANIDLTQFQEYQNYLHCPQLFFIYMENSGKHTSNPINFYVAKRIIENNQFKLDQISINKSLFHTHLLVINYIVNNCSNNDFVIYSFNTDKNMLQKIEQNINRTRKSLLKKVFIL